MFKLIANLVMNAVSLYIVSSIIPGIYLDNFRSALFAILIISLVNTFIKPIIIILTLPVNIVTLGLFTLVINALMFAFASFLTPGFQISGFADAFWGTLLYSIITWFLKMLVK